MKYHDIMNSDNININNEYKNYVRKSIRVPTPPENPFRDSSSATTTTEYFNNHQYSVHQRSRDYLMNIYNSKNNLNQTQSDNIITSTTDINEPSPVLINAGLKLNSNEATLEILSPFPKSSSISPLLSIDDNKDQISNNFCEVNISESKFSGVYHINSQKSEIINPFSDSNNFSPSINSECALATCDIINELAVSNESDRFQNNNINEFNIKEHDSNDKSNEKLISINADFSNDDRNLKTADTLNTLKYHNDLRVKFEKIVPNLSNDEINLILNSNIKKSENNKNENFWKNLNCLQNPKPELTILKTKIENSKDDNPNLFEFPSPNFKKNDDLSTLSTESVKISKLNSNLQNYKNFKKKININPISENLITPETETETDEFYSNTDSNTNSKSIMSSLQTFSSHISSDNLDYYSKRYLTDSISPIESTKTSKRKLRLGIFHRRNKKKIPQLPLNESPNLTSNEVLNECFNIDDQELSTTVKNRSLYSKLFKTKSTKEGDNNDTIETKSLNSFSISDNSVNKKSYHHHHSLRNLFKK